MMQNPSLKNSYNKTILTIKSCKSIIQLDGANKMIKNFKKFLEGEAEAAEHGFKALMEDFTNYQVKCDRELAKLEKELEVKTKQLERSQVKLQKDLPNIIRKTIAHIEFAQPLDRK